MSVVADLLSAITAEPDDPGPQLVLADSLISAGDSRGELIVLDHLDREGRLDEPEAIERMVLLAAEYGFPHARDQAEPELPWRGSRQAPVRWELHHEGRHYLVEYANGLMLVSWPGEGPELETNLWEMKVHDSDEWTGEETHTILSLLGDALRAGAPLAELQFPFGDAPLPQYEGCPTRGYALPVVFTKVYRVARNRYGLAARDYHRWYSLWARLLNAREHHW